MSEAHVSGTSPPTPAPAPRRRLGPRVWRGLAAALVLLLIAIGGVGWYALKTQDGLHFVLAQIQRWTDGGVTVGSARGHVLGELDLRDIHYAGRDGTVVTIKRVHLRYLPNALLARRFHVTALDVETLDVTPGAARVPAAPATPNTLPVRLPVDVIVDALSLDGFALHSVSHPEAKPFVIDHAEFAGQWLGDTIDVHELTTALALTGPLKAQAKARMGRDHIAFENLLIEGPGALRATGTLGIDDRAHSDLTVVFERLHWPLVLAGDAPPQVGDIHGEFRLTGTTAEYAYTLKTNATLQGHAAQLAANGRGSLDAAHIDALRLDTLAGDGLDAERNAKTAGVRGSVSASGDVVWTPVLKADLQAMLEHVDPAWFVAGVSGDINGRLDTHTTMGEARPEIVFTADIARSTLRGQPFSLTAEGSTDTARAALKTLVLQAGGGSVKAQGAVAWLPRLRIDADARIAKLNPALFAADWPGEINGEVLVRTASEASAPIRFDARIADSRLRGYPLKLDAQATVDGAVVIVQQLKLNSGSTRLDASGQVTPPFDAAGRFESPDLAALVPKLSGRAAFDFKLQGTIEQPHLVTKGEASSLKYGEQTLAKLGWNADVDPTVDSTISVTASDADVGLHVSTLNLRMTGLEIYHRLELKAETERGTASLALQGGFDRKRAEWGGELATLDFAPTGLADWKLDKSAGILLGQTRRALELACLQSAEGRACFNLEQNVLSDGTRVGWNIEHLLLVAFQPFLPRQYRVGGSIDGEGHINFTGGDIVDAMAVLNLHEAKLEVPDAPALLLNTGSLHADQREGRLHGVAELSTEQGQVTADVAAAPGDRFDERALSGSVKIDFPTLAFLEPLLPQLRALDGKLLGNLELAGTPKRPRFGGQIALSEAHAKLVAAGIELKDVQVRILADREGPLTVDGQLQSGDGTMRLTGTVDPFATPLFADIALEGEDFQALNTAQARAWIAPKLRLVRDAKGATLTGELTVPRADITPKGFGGGGVDVSADQVLIGAEVPPPQTQLPVYADLRLALGDRVQIEGFGLKTRIEGAVNVTQEPRRGALGRGELRLIDGHYKAYGQDLTIETGRLIFTGGPVTTPAVDLYATRQPREDITVGVRVRGTLAKPELTLQSSPTLPREQQLSWLVLGRSLETSSTQDRSLVSSAALSLGLGGGDYLAGLIGKRVGLDELSVGGATGNSSEVAANSQSIAGSQSAASTVDASAQAAQLTLGKYLTPRLFVSYGISLFQQGYSVRLLYSLGRGFKLSTETGTASGGDIIYTTERGLRKKSTAKPDAPDAAAKNAEPPKPLLPPDTSTGDPPK